MPNTARAESAEPLRAGPLLRLVRGPRLTPPEPHPERELFSGLRVVRTLAMLSIVGYHVTWQPIFGIAFGLTSLQIIMCALTGQADAPRSMGRFARKRALRLLAPWLLWSAVYGAFELSRSLLAGEPALARFEPWMWFSGASFHLWFLPFAFVASLIVNASLHLLRAPRPELHATAAALLGSGLLLAVDPLKLVLAPGTPFDLWIDGAPTLAFGLAVGRALCLTDRLRRAKLLLGIALAGLAPFLLGATLIPSSGLFERYAVAIPVVCLGLLLPLRERPWMATVAATNLGVYLVHMLAIRVTDHVPGVVHLPGSVRTVLVYLVCLGIVLLVRRCRIPWAA